MKRTIFFSIAVLTCSGALAQTFLPHKHLVFAQVAAGGGYETAITVTNRGSNTYTSTLYLTTGDGFVWNPTVNGSPTSNGKVAISLPSRTTSTYLFTGGPTVEVGYAEFFTSMLALTSFVEGHLTYVIRSGSTVLDSVGISPSTEFYLASLPFEDFSSIALALANPNLGAANPTLVLFSEGGIELARTNFPLAQFAHRARFLSELFPQIRLTRGRVDIQSNLALVGTALTLTQC